MAKLKNLKHEQFALEYSIELNATKAYRSVYGDNKGVEANASRLLKNAKVQERVKELAVNKEKKAVVKSFNVIQELEKLAKARAIDVFDFTGETLTIKKLDDIPEDCQCAIESIETMQVGEFGTVTKVKFHSKLKALELLGRHFGLFNDKLEVGIKPQSIEQLVNSTKAK